MYTLMHKEKCGGGLAFRGERVEKVCIGSQISVSLAHCIEGGPERKLNIYEMMSWE